MGKFTKLGIGVTAVALVLCGVSCKEETNEISANVSAAMGNLCDEVAEVTCHNYFECCRGVQLEAMLGVEITTTEDTCRDDVRLQCEQGMATRQYAMDQGRLSLLEKNVNACLEAYLVGEDGCFPYVTDSWPACDVPLFQGKQDAGQACLQNFECKEEHYCGGDRVCRAYAGKHDPCSAAQCASAYYCGTDTDVSSDGPVCLPLKKAGEECTGSGQCEAGSACQMNEDGNAMECTALKALGESCDSDGVCDSGFCLTGSCDDGSECESDAQCAGTCSESNTTCTTDASCGGSCQDSGANCYGDDDCGRCDTSGDSCGDNTDCPGHCLVSGYSCDSDAYCDMYSDGDTCEFETCNPDTCVPNQQCIGSSECRNRVCAERYFALDYCQGSPFDSMFTTH